MNGGNLRDRLAAAMPLLNRAVEIDPGFAAAWAQLAVFHAGAFISQIDPTEARLAQAREDLARARQLAPDSLEVVEAQRQVASLIGDNKTEADQVRRMVELFPGKVESHSALAELAWEEKRWKDALDEFDQALALDPRGAATIESIRYANLGLRRYEQAEAMTRRLRELLPPALLRLFQFGLVSYWASGATGELDALLAKYSPEQKLSDPDVIIIQAQWLFMRGQSRELIQLWEKTGPKFRFSYTTGRFEKISIALALLKEGQPERARPLLEEERRRIEATLGNAKGTRTQQANLALTCALLGDATGADAAIAAGRNLPVVNLVDDGVMVAADAWLGRKDSAITAIAQAIRTPSVSPYFCNSHQIRYDLIWWPLQGDPRFQALIDDPKNNAPLF